MILRMRTVLTSVLVAALATSVLAGGKPKPPVVSIVNPANGATFDVGAVVQFAGTAIDKADGDLSGSIQWASDQVWFGQGANLAATLPEGSSTRINTQPTSMSKPLPA